MRRRAWAVAIAVSAIFPASPRAAGAQPAVTQAPARRDVQVAIVGDASEASALEASLRELLARIDLSLVQEGKGVDATALARVRIDLTQPSAASIIVTDGQTGEVVESRSIPRDASPPVVREEIADAVRSAVESKLLVDAPAKRAPPPPPPPPAPTPEPAPPPVVITSPIVVEAPNDASRATRSGSPLAIDLATFAGAGPFASGAGPVARVGGGASIAWRRGLRPALTATLAYALPFDASSDLVVSHANVVSARALASIELARASWIALGVAAGGGFDAMSVDPDSSVLPASALGGHTLRTDAIVTGAIEARVPLATSVVVAVDASADVDLASRRYVVDDAGRESALLTPWRVRPTITAGFVFTALGEGLFAKSAAKEGPP